MSFVRHLLDKGKLPLSANNMKAIEDGLCSSRGRPCGRVEQRQAWFSANQDGSCL
ncbi:hypothetical protein HCBG_06671 [Histoplasma capsulatum G186AR]|uniref:Uncharacterized protein n=1 Tax=Ajellomyces capsulatus (strain G186AR / H82 / ATCC MYA-2454 / RMSCC 2432) TaxID=447093 RepID=C0NUQ7_AJECG|nr:uncharacterized protein HCBG_06671 [Histoplasma capsulatum G186AR]EEH04720.1 hypothetical protein HCBG_06671 [Histoplasma capsulatum G186AR]